MSKRRLAWVFPGFGVGGAQVRACAIVNRFGPGFRHSFVALNGDTACREKLVAEADVSFPPSGHIKGSMLAASLNARRVLRDLAPDLVVTSNWGAIEWAAGARLAGLAHVHTEDGFGPEEQSSQIRRRVLTRRLVLRGSAVGLPSRRLLGIARDEWKLPVRQLHYIPNGVDLARFAGAVPMTLAPGEGPVIGTIAALRPEKNIARLLRAFAVVRARGAARLVIVGDGPERAGLHALAGELGVASDVLFAGHSREAERWLASFDVFALSSDTEQMPISLLEAMAAGVAAVSTDVGDVRLMLPDEAADFVVAREDAALADALARMLGADMRTLGAANRARACAVFDEEAMFAAWGRLLGLKL